MSPIHDAIRARAASTLERPVKFVISRPQARGVRRPGRVLRASFAAVLGALLLGVWTPLSLPVDVRVERSARSRNFSNELQRAVTRSMQGRAGAALVLDVDSGRVLAHYRLEAAARTLARPGSAVKPFTLLALIESGRVAIEQPVRCARRLRLGSQRLDCTHPADSRPLAARDALAYSCNSYFAQLARALDDSELARAFEHAGLTAVSGLVEGEAAGRVRLPRSLEQRQLLALGQANVEVTPLGIAAAYRKLAQARKRPERDARRAPVFDGLEDSVRFGMARLARAPGIIVAGKTGTASSQSGYTHAWFAGYAPAAAPEIVLVVFFEQGRGGPDAAPVAGEIFAAYAAARGLQ
jgi:penicillin-binding protein 2